MYCSSSAAALPAKPPGQLRYLILLLVLKRIQGGMGLFCLAFLASFFLMAKAFWDGCRAVKGPYELEFTQKRIATLQPTFSHSSKGPRW